MRRFRIGTRGSPLALAQANETMARIAAAKGWSEAEAAERMERVVIKTTGDQVLDRPLAEAGGKGLFVKELEEALADGRCDLAVHSMKDVPGDLPPGFAIVAALPREDARDALIARDPAVASIADLPKGARVGTTSPRRKAALLNARPDLEPVLFRGNVGTRLAKLDLGEADATMLAMAGLNRLGLKPRVSPLDPDEMIPAAGQGVVGIEAREDDAEAIALAQAAGDAEAWLALAAERAFLAALGGSCRSSVAGHARRSADGRLAFAAALYAPDGTERVDWRGRAEATLDAAAAMGRDGGLSLKARGGAWLI